MKKPSKEKMNHFNEDNFFYKDECRLCSSKELVPVISLNKTPLANHFVSNPQSQICFDLNLLECINCGHVQLSIVVDPRILYQNYLYVSGTNSTFIKHFENYASHIIQRFNLQKNSKVFEIGCNDCTLLNFFSKAGMTCYGIDPAKQIVNKCKEKGFNVIEGYFGYESDKIVYDYIGDKVKIIVANNVLAHCDDLNQIAKSVKKLLSNDGIFIFEVSYLVDVINNCLFDTIYHEHLDYHHLSPLFGFFKKHDLKIFNAEKVETHGGSLRVYVCHDDNKKYDYDLEDTSLINAMKIGENWDFYLNIKSLIKEENKLGLKIDISKAPGMKINKYPFHDKILKNIHEMSKVSDYLNNNKRLGKKIAIYGAPAKLTTLVYQLEINSSIISYVIDDSKMKQNLFTPGWNLPIFSSKKITEDPVDIILISAWNFSKDIVLHNRSFIESGGKFIIPLPEFLEINSYNIDNYLK